MNHNGSEPGMYCGFTTKCSQFVVCHPIRFLEPRFCLRVIPQDISGRAVKRPVIPSHQQCECAFIPGQNPLHDVDIALLLPLFARRAVLDCGLRCRDRDITSDDATSPDVPSMPLMVAARLTRLEAAVLFGNAAIRGFI